MLDPECEHELIAPQAIDQTVGVVCLGCEGVLAGCWMDKHVPEDLWNRACDGEYNGSGWKRCKQSRPNVCALCKVTFTRTEIPEGEGR